MGSHQDFLDPEPIKKVLLVVVLMVVAKGRNVVLMVWFFAIRGLYTLILPASCQSEAPSMSVVKMVPQRARQNVP